MHSVCHGPVPGDTLLSSGRHMRIEFVSSPFLPAMIHFTYRAVYPGGIHCTAESRTLQALQADGAMENTHSLTYETWPGSYENNLHCAWLITTTHRGHVIKLQVVDMDVEFRFGCCADNVTIYDGSVPSSSKVLARLCGHTLETMYSNDQAMHIVFQTDSSVAKRGFLLRYSSVVPENHETYSPYRPHRRTPTTTTSTTSHRISSTTRKSYKSHEKQPHDVGSRTVYNNSTVFMMTSPASQALYFPGAFAVAESGATNPAFSSDRDSPSLVLQFAAQSFVEPVSVWSCSVGPDLLMLVPRLPYAGAPPPDAGAPPSYAEATRLALPPADPSAPGDRAEHDLRHQ
ncbi:hypothetical protein BaRGS_00001701, partial [Batillaria attramentaria]